MSNTIKGIPLWEYCLQRRAMRPRRLLSGLGVLGVLDEGAWLGISEDHLLQICKVFTETDLWLGAYILVRGDCLAEEEPRIYDLIKLILTVY